MVIFCDTYVDFNDARRCQCNRSYKNNIIMRVRYNINNNNAYNGIRYYYDMYIRCSRATVSRSPKPLSYYQTDYNDAWDIKLL